MTKNPLVNALAAALYIVLIGSVMFYGLGRTGPPNTAIIPIAVISLFTLSAAVMGYLFVYSPLLLYVDGEKTEAVNLFLQTVGVFAGITVVILIILISGVLT